MKHFLLAFISTALTASALWPPAVVLEPDHPRILFTASDSAEIAARIATTPFSSYYSSVWSRANNTSGNASQAEDFSRSAIAMSAAFVLYFGVQPGGDTLTTAQRTNLQTKAVDYLDNMLTSLDGSIYDNSSYHYPCQRLIQYCVAYDLLTGAGISVYSANIRSLANTIYDGATYWLLGYPVDAISLFMNHKLIVGGALGCAAVTLPSDGEDWIHYAMTKINKIAFTDESDPTRITGFAEGPHYFKYSMEHLLQFFMGMKHYCGDITQSYTDPCGGTDNANVRTFFYHEGWDSIYHWISAIRLPDGTMPPLDDSFRRNGLCHTAPFAERNADFFWGASGGGSRMFLNPMLIAVGAEACPPLGAGLTSLPHAGNLIFRSGPEQGNIYFHMLAENGIANTATHNQADEASFYINAFGEDIAFDPGYISYTHRDSVNKCTNHNMILVNGSATTTLSPRASYITDAFAIPMIYFGKASTNYQSTDIERRCMLLGDRFAVIVDDIRRGSSATHTFQCHGNGLQSAGTFAPTPQGGIWTGADSSALELAIVAVDGVSGIDYEIGTHETGYNSWAHHTVARVRKSSGNTKFVSVMFPFRQSGEGMSVFVPTATGQATLRWGAHGLAGAVAATANPAPFIVPETDELPSVEGHGEGAIALFDSASGGLLALYAMVCDSVTVDGAKVFDGQGSRVDLGLHFGEDNVITGYLNSDAATIAIRLSSAPTSVVGAISHIWTGEELHLNLAGRAKFTIDATPLAIPEIALPEALTISAYPNPFNGAVTIVVDCHSRESGNPEAVAVEIFDINGRRVAELPGGGTVGEGLRPSRVSQTIETGGSETAPLRNGEFTWHPAADLPSGVYLVRARVDSRSLSGGPRAESRGATATTTTAIKRLVYLK